MQPFCRTILGYGRHESHVLHILTFALCPGMRGNPPVSQNLSFHVASLEPSPCSSLMATCYSELARWYFIYGAPFEFNSMDANTAT